MPNINATMGVKSIKYAVITNGTPGTLTAVSDVYQDSATFVTKDPTVTEHKSETSTKRIVMATKEGHTLAFSIMDPTPAELAAFMGGTVSNGSYTESESAEQIQMKFEVEPVQGLKLTIATSSVSAKINTTYSAKGITLLDVTANTTSAISYAPAT
ncbi:MAG: hypothetical protein K6E94_00495 [Elusimicrobiaceae bacterium]|nr:hypothetical protein [Elusimicrobiaceae bacterium]